MSFASFLNRQQIIAVLNQVLDVTAGTAKASMALILGADKNVDTLAIADGGLKLGSGAGTAVTASAAELNKLDGIAAGAYMAVCESRMFTATGAGTYTATVAIPANSLVLEVAVNNVVVWDSATSATLDVGDAGDAEGYFKDINVKTTPAVGTTLSNLMSSTGSGAYKGLPKWYESAATITATLVAVGAGSAGRTRLNVISSHPTPVDATKA